MPKNAIPLTADQIDSFREVGSIGAGQAASRLADLIQRKCIVSVPQLLFADLQGIKQTFDVPDSFAVALHIRVMGDIPACVFIITRRVHAQILVRHMTKASLRTAGRDLDFTSQFALKQLAELLIRSFSDAIGRFLRVKARYAMPELVMETWSNALDTVLRQVEDPDRLQMAIYADFFDVERTFEGKFVYVLGPSAQAMVLDRIRLLLEET